MAAKKGFYPLVSGIGACGFPAKNSGITEEKKDEKTEQTLGTNEEKKREEKITPEKDAKLKMKS